MPTYDELYPQSDEDQNQEPHQDQPTRRRCRHIFAAGRRCGSPCLRNTDFCYYHHTTRRPVNNPRERRNRTDVFDLPNPEDRDGARAAVTQIMHAIAHNNIDLKRAGMLLYSLQISLCTLPPQPRPAPLKAANCIPLKDIVEDLVYEEPHGFIAPEDVYEEPEELKPRKTLAQQLYEEVERCEARRADEKAHEEYEATRQAALDAFAAEDAKLDREAIKDLKKYGLEPGPDRCAPIQSLDSEAAIPPAQQNRPEQPPKPTPQRPAAIDLRAAAEDTPQRKCHPERSLARTCAKRSRRTCGSLTPPQHPEPFNHNSPGSNRSQHTRARLICLQSASSKALSNHALEEDRCRSGNNAPRPRRMQPSGHRSRVGRQRRSGPAARAG